MLLRSSSEMMIAVGTHKKPQNVYTADSLVHQSLEALSSVFSHCVSTTVWSCHLRAARNRVHVETGDFQNRCKRSDRSLNGTHMPLLPLRCGCTLPFDDHADSFRWLRGAELAPPGAMAALRLQPVCCLPSAALALVAQCPDICCSCRTPWAACAPLGAPHTFLWEPPPRHGPSAKALRNQRVLLDLPICKSAFPACPPTSRAPHSDARNR